MVFLLGIVFGLCVVWMAVGSFFVVLGGQAPRQREVFEVYVIPLAIICLCVYLARL